MTKRWGALIILGMAQFVMVLDQAVMNVSISTLVDDFDTTVPTIQAVITMYSLVMAAGMITGGKIGDLIGRKKAFTIGLVIYAIGSALTAVSWSVEVLAFGWSFLEGIGAALVLPALAALVAGNYEGPSRATAYAVIGGIAGAGVAVGPILGGYVTTYLDWRLVFVGEVVWCVLILLMLRLLVDAPREGAAPKLDVVGAVLSAAGMALVVFGFLQSSTWGWLAPKSSPIEPFGFSLTPFVLAAGAGLLVAFRSWQRHREDRGQDPLVHFALLRIDAVRSGLTSFLAQNLALMGLFFVIPLYLQLVQGLDAFETGLRMLPVSVTMFISSMAGPALARRMAPRTVVRIGFVVLIASALMLLSVIDPVLSGGPFTVAMALIGVGLGLIASQLGNVVQSALGAGDRSEGGGLQYTAQQLGSAVGVALIGSIVLTGLGSAFLRDVQDNPAIDAEIQDQVAVEIQDGISFVPSDDVAAAVDEAGVDDATADELVDGYEDAQLWSLKVGLLAVAAIAAVALIGTRGLPATPPGREPSSSLAPEGSSV